MGHPQRWLLQQWLLVLRMNFCVAEALPAYINGIDDPPRFRFPKEINMKPVYRWANDPAPDFRTSVGWQSSKQVVATDPSSSIVHKHGKATALGTVNRTFLRSRRRVRAAQ